MKPTTLLKRGTAAALLTGLMAIGGAQAQIQGNGPVEINADEFVGISAQNLATYRGSVEVLQDQTRLRCSELRIQYASRGGQQASGIGGSFGDVERMTCLGPVYYVTPTETARSDQAVYETRSEVITMTGSVVVTQGQNVATGDRAVINTRTRDYRLESNTPGPRAGRVRTVIYPDNASRPAAAAAPSGAGGAAGQP